MSRTSHIHAYLYCSFALPMLFSRKNSQIVPLYSCSLHQYLVKQADQSKQRNVAILLSYDAIICNVIKLDKE